MVTLAHSLSIIYLRRESRPLSSLWLVLTLALIAGAFIGLLWLVSLRVLLLCDAFLYATVSSALYMALSYLMTVMQRSESPTLTVMTE